MAKATSPKNEKAICGIVMPISAIDGCSESHWNDVMEIISEAIEDAEFEPNIVSNADDIGVIQKRIIQNLYDNPIVICDVSGKNPNVMFELGIRLAFDKPTIIIKDDKTTYSFDTSPIEHLEYPRDLRFNKIQEFKEKLTDKIIKTFEKAKNEPEFSTFLKHFGEFKVAKIEQKEVSQQEFILDEIKNLRSLIINSTNRSNGRFYPPSKKENEVDVCCAGAAKDKIISVLPTIEALEDVVRTNLYERGPDHHHLRVTIGNFADRERLRKEIRELVGARRIPAKKGKS